MEFRRVNIHHKKLFEHAKKIDNKLICSGAVIEESIECHAWSKQEPDKRISYGFFEDIKAADKFAQSVINSELND